MKLLVATTLLLASAATASPQRNGRGLFEDAQQWMDSLHTEIDNMQMSARQDFAQLKPLAERVEQELQPAFKQVEHSLGHAFKSLARTPELLGLGPVHEDIDRVGAVEGEVGQQTPIVNPGAIFNQFQDEAFNPFSLFRLASRRNWWEGDNVCVDRKVIEEPEEKKDDAIPGLIMDMTMTSCRNEQNFHECTTHVNNYGQKKTVIVKHECCHGYMRSTSGDEGCTKMVMKTLEETIGDLDASEFLQMLETTDAMSVLADHNVTVFAPTNDAVEDFRHDLEQINAVEDNSNVVEYNIDDGLNRRRKRSEITIVETPRLVDILKGHMVEGFVDSSDIRDEDVMSSMSDTESGLRFTVYNTGRGLPWLDGAAVPQKTMMVNCARVVSSDHMASNGVVHLLDKVILPAIKSLAEILTTDSQFSHLANVLRKADLLQALDKPGQLTLFAPTDKAFDNLDAKNKAKLDAGNGCSQDILNNHILPNVICSGVVETKAKTFNVLNKYLMLERGEENDELYVEDAKVTMYDIVGSNGVIHVIDKVLIPHAARSVGEVLEQQGSDTLLELFQLAGLEDSDLDNTTLFAPSEAALNALPKTVLDDLKADKDKLQEFLLYHVVIPKTCKCDFENNKVLESGLDGQSLRLNIHAEAGPFGLVTRKSATVQCARITHLDEEVCGGLIHTVDKVLLPPGGNAMEVIKNHGTFKTFLELIVVSGLENELNTEGPFTILAPTDSAFDYMDKDVKDKIFDDQDLAAQVVRHHIIQDNVCCGAFAKQVPFFDLTGHRTLDGDIISLRRSHGGHIYAERSEVTTCDMLASNGVIHAIDRVILPESISPESAETAQEKTSPFVIFSLFDKK